MADLSNKFCRKPFEHFEVHPNGNVSLCCYSWLPFHAGRITKSNSVKEVFNSDIVKGIRESIHDGSFRYCKHDLCPHIQNGELPDKDQVEGPRMKEIVQDRLTDNLMPDFYNLCYDESCNLQCPSCRANKISFIDGRQYERRKEIQDRIIKDLFYTPHTKNCTVNITGSGDPFGSKLFRELLFNVDCKLCPNIWINLQTNGVMFTEKFWNKMHKIQDRINTVIVSYDAGTEETYNVTRKGGDWGQLQTNMKFLSQLRADNKINELRIDFVVQQANYREMERVVKIGKQLGVDTVYFSMVVNWGTWTDSEFMERAVYGQHHVEHADFLDHLDNPIFDDPIVDLGNITQFRNFVTV